MSDNRFFRSVALAVQLRASGTSLVSLFPRTFTLHFLIVSAVSTRVRERQGSTSSCAPSLKCEPCTVNPEPVVEPRCCFNRREAFLVTFNGKEFLSGSIRTDMTGVHNSTPDTRLPAGCEYMSVEALLLSFAATLRTKLSCQTYTTIILLN